MYRLHTDTIPFYIRGWASVGFGIHSKGAGVFWNWSPLTPKATVQQMGSSTQGLIRLKSRCRLDAFPLEFWTLFWLTQALEFSQISHRSGRDPSAWAISCTRWKPDSGTESGRNVSIPGTALTTTQTVGLRSLLSSKFLFKTKLASLSWVFPLKT